MPSRPVVLTIGSRDYKVMSSASPKDLTRLAEIVATKLAEIVPPGKAEPPQALLLAALALAHDLEEERARTLSVQRRGRDMLRRVLVRLDSVLDRDDGGGE